jgi:hypothetical protein
VARQAPVKQNDSTTKNSVPGGGADRRRMVITWICGLNESEKRFRFYQLCPVLCGIKYSQPDGTQPWPP